MGLVLENSRSSELWAPTGEVVLQEKAANYNLFLFYLNVRNKRFSIHLVSYSSFADGNM